MEQVKHLIDRLSTFFYALVGLPMLLFAVVFLPIKDQLSWQTSQGIALEMLRYLVAVVLIVTAIWELRRSTARIKGITKEQDFISKIHEFVQISRRAYLWVLVLSLVSVGLLYLTQNQLFVVVYALLLFLVSLYRPTFHRIRRYLPLTEEEYGAIKDQL